MFRLAFTGIAIAASLSAACGGEEDKPMTPERELAHLAWELMKPLDASHECKKIGDALVPWLETHAPRFAELTGQVKKLSGADANNFDRVKIRLGDIARRCANPTGPKTVFTTRDERVAKVVALFPKTTMGFEMR